MRDFAQDRDLRETAPDFVVEIGGDALADALELGEALFAGAQQLFFGVLSLADIADGADEVVPAAAREFAEGNFEGYFRAVLAQSGQFDGLPGEASLAGGAIAGEAGAMAVAHIFRHEH